MRQYDLNEKRPDVPASFGYAIPTSSVDAGLVFHGLRKNAVNTLLEVGCTEAEVSAIVEMSEQMVRHYARDVNKRRLARSGTAKMEAGWSETRKQIFGKALERPASA